MRVMQHYPNVIIEVGKRDTENWAIRPGSAWPCSTIRGRSFTANFTFTGELIDHNLKGHIDEHELMVMCKDLLFEASEQTWRARRQRAILHNAAMTIVV